jgi:DNA-binding transcriptional ArsR family regulator
MKTEGPDSALLVSLIGDPARAIMLTQLMSGKALTASELAKQAGITVQTTSSHLMKLQAAALLRQRKQGRYLYYCLANDQVRSVLEDIMGAAANGGLIPIRTGPKDPALRKARSCHGHLAGEFGVRMYDSLISRTLVLENGDGVELSAAGEQFASAFGIDLTSLAKSQRPLCKACLDWSARRTHLAGSLGAALLLRIFELGWAKKSDQARVVAFTSKGEQHFLDAFAA